MKITSHIPTEQFGYIEIEHDKVDPDSVWNEYTLYSGFFKEGIGVPDKEMNGVVDTMLQGQSVRGGIEIYERMDLKQKYAIQTIKRALKRNNHESEQES